MHVQSPLATKHLSSHARSRPAYAIARYPISVLGKRPHTASVFRSFCARVGGYELDHNDLDALVKVARELPLHATLIAVGPPPFLVVQPGPAVRVLMLGDLPHERFTEATYLAIGRLPTT